MFRAMGYPQARQVARSLAQFRKKMGDAAFTEALARAPETMADIFRHLAGPKGEKMAEGFSVSPEDIQADTQKAAENSLAELSPDAKTCLDMKRLVG